MRKEKTSMALIPQGAVPKGFSFTKQTLLTGATFTSLSVLPFAITFHSTSGLRNGMNETPVDPSVLWPFTHPDNFAISACDDRAIDPKICTSSWVPVPTGTRTRHGENGGAI